MGLHVPLQILFQTLFTIKILLYLHRLRFHLMCVVLLEINLEKLLELIELVE